MTLKKTLLRNLIYASRFFSENTILLLIIACCLLPTFAFAQPPFQWAFRVGSPVAGSSWWQTGRDYGYAIAVDGTGNVYVAGRFDNTVDFDPGSGTFNLTSAGQSDLYLAKYTSVGGFLWAFNAGAAGWDDIEDIEVDATGNVYATGSFRGTADFDPSGNTANLTATGNDLFIAKYNSAGAYQWAFNVAESDDGYGIALDGSGNVYVTGYFSGTADFDPSATAANFTSVGGEDIFIAKYNSAGVYQWAVNMGSSGNDEGYNIDVSKAGDVYVTGSFTNSADFDPTAATYTLSSIGSQDIFVAKYTSGGAFQWAINVGSTGDDVGQNIAVDGSGNAYVTGYFSGAADFNPGASVVTLNSAGSEDIFVAKYSSAGAYQWAFNIGATGKDKGENIITDGSGNVYVTGSFTDVVDFKPGGGGTKLTSAGSEDIFLAQYNSAGVYQWAFNVGSADEDRGESIALDGGSIYITGSFTNTADFDPSASNADLTSIGFEDIFVAKYGSSLLSVNTSYSDIKCNGKCDGTATANGSGGAGTYTYSWSNFKTDQSVTGLCAGTYTVTIKDAASATMTATVTITQPATALTAIATATASTSCATNNGAVSVTATGGTPNYTYSWSNGSTQSATSNLQPATYSITVTDANGCSTAVNTTIVNAPNNTLSVTATSIQSACTGNTGTATAIATGGVPTYTFNWSNGQTTSSATALAAGNYTITITDVNSCTKDYVVTVAAASTFSVSVTSMQTDCSTSTGTATAFVLGGGTPPYTFSWSNGATQSAISNLQPATYSITVTDTYGCSATNTTTVTSIGGPTVTVTTTSNTIILGDSVILIATGGSTYNWTPATGLSCPTCANTMTTPTVTTNYCVTATDVNGCSDTKCVLIKVDIICDELFIPSAFSPNNDEVNDKLCVRGNCIKTVSFSIYDRWGMRVYKSIDPKNLCWDGVFHGTLMNSAVFVYYFEATLINGDKKKMKGNISLIR